MYRTTVLLLACFILAQADKQVMALTGLRIQQDFGLSNTQLGFLQGGAFAIAFAIGGIPIARLVDTGHRIRLAAVCVLAWSVATMLCGLAGDFLTLVLLRAATAVAEAGLPPAAFSIFSQNGDSRAVARQTGIFMLAPFVGTGLMLLLGGMLIELLDGSIATSHSNTASWRIVFFALGGLGLAVAPALWSFGREPVRARASSRAVALREVLRHVFVSTPWLRHYFAAMTAFYMVVAAFLAWYPTLLVRSMGVTPGAAGASAGAAYLIGGVAGTLAATALFSTRRDLGANTIVRTFLAASMLLGPVMVLLPLATSMALSLLLYGIFAFLSAAVLATMPLPLQLGLERHMLARGLAIISLLMSAVAGTVGPMMVGVVMDAVGASLAAILATLAATGLGGATAFLALASTLPSKTVTIR